MPTIKQWLECEGLPVAKCNRYRERHGHSPLPNRTNVHESTADHKKKPRGLGDTIAAITRATGLDVLAKRTAKLLGYSDCGCGKRQAWMNGLWPHK